MGTGFYPVKHTTGNNAISYPISAASNYVSINQGLTVDQSIGIDLSATSKASIEVANTILASQASLNTKTIVMM